jgi:stage II sporulation protein AA (anti-sigma F factor antagonist)
MKSSGVQLSREPFDVRLERHGRTVLVRLSGEFDDSFRSEFEARLFEAASMEPREIVLDLRRLAFIGSSGLRFLLRVWNLSCGTAFDFAVLPAAGAVRLQFTMTQLDQVLPIIEQVADLSDALMIPRRN